jgi:long-chain fatty acid transport protein
MKMIKRLAALIAIIFLLAQTAFAGGFALSGVGSKAIGMGGAFRGLADDWSAAYWNPAGLTQIKGSELNAMLVAISPRPQYIPSIYYGGLDVGYRNDGLVHYPDDKTSFVPDFSGFFRLSMIKDYTVGMAIFVPYALGSRWDIFDGSGLDLNSPYPIWDHKANLSVIDFHPTVAKAFLQDKLSLGLGVSIQRGSITFQKTNLQPITPEIPVPHENLVINSVMKGNGWGFGANFGLLYKFNDKMQVGVSGRTGSTLKLKGTANEELFTFNNNDLYNILLGQAQTLADTLNIRFLFASKNPTASPSAKADLKTPADIGFGLACKPSEKLTLTGDVAYTQWSSLKSIIIKLTGADPAGQPAQNSTIMLNWKNTVRVSLGAEYLATKALLFRLGYYMDPSPIPDATFLPLIPDLGTKNSLNLGSAIRAYGMEFSYNFEYLMFKDRTVTTISDVNNDGVYDNYPGAYKMKLYASHFSLTYRF